MAILNQAWIKRSILLHMACMLAVFIPIRLP